MLSSEPISEGWPKFFTSKENTCLAAAFRAPISCDVGRPMQPPCRTERQPSHGPGRPRENDLTTGRTRIVAFTRARALKSEEEARVAEVLDSQAMRDPNLQLDARTSSSSSHGWSGFARHCRQLMSGVPNLRRQTAP